jgi:hypothetical protein
MADTATIELKATFSDSSVTGSLKAASLIATFTVSADEVYAHRIEAALGGSTIGLTHFASVDYLIVHNTDTTNYVSLQWDDAVPETETIKIDAGKFTVMPDVDPSAAVIITSNTAVCMCDVWVIGS